MDKIDRKIINSLQKNARASLKDLSKECFISSPVIAARINNCLLYTSPSPRDCS